MSSDELRSLTREELLDGRLAPGRRASTVLFAIESITAHLVARSQRATAWYLTAKAVEERERAFFEALAAGRDLPLEPTIQDIERYAANWSSLVSEADPSVRSALAHALALKYSFTQRAVPGIRAALGLDTEPIQQAYQRLYDQPLSSLYKKEITVGNRIRWVLSALAERLESLPPFWVAFALTLPVGPGLLALPIAVADVGALPGILLLIFFGLINALTAAALAEAVARSGTTRFGLGYLGQLVSEYLGDAGSVLLTVILIVNNFLVLIVFYLGVAGTLEGALRLPAELWIGALFAVGLYFLSRKSLNSTVASTLMVTITNVTLLIVIPVFAIPHIQPANLANVRIPFVGGQPYDPAILTLIFGVMLTNFFSHLLIANYGQVILRRDGSARSWIWGCIAAIGLTTLISCLWVVTFNGALSPEVLAQETGTALTALAAQVGPTVNWLGSVFVVLSLGMACIHISLGLLFLVEERLPVRTGSLVGGRGRFFLSISPVVAVFLISEWLSITGQGSFAGLLGFVGVIALPLLGGIFPVLLLAATRRKGDFVPGLILRSLGNPVLLVGLYVFFLVAIFAYALFIWDGPLERLATFLIGSAIFAVTLIMLRQGALDSRLVVELRGDFSRSGQHLFNVTAGGQPLKAEGWLSYRDRRQRIQGATGLIDAFASLRSATFLLPATGAKTLKVWVHQITPQRNSEGLPALLTVHSNGDRREFHLERSSGQVVLPIDGGACRLETLLMGFSPPL